MGFNIDANKMMLKITNEVKKQLLRFFSSLKRTVLKGTVLFNPYFQFLRRLLHPPIIHRGREPIPATHLPVFISFRGIILVSHIFLCNFLFFPLPGN